MGEVAEHLATVFIEDSGTNRNRQNEVFTTLTRAISPAATVTAVGTKLSLKPVIHQGIQSGISLQVYAASIAAVTTIGTTPGNVFFTAEAEAAIATFAGLHADRCFIYKFHWDSLLPGASTYCRAATASLRILRIKKGPVN
jgi:hypothetical protein